MVRVMKSLRHLPAVVLSLSILTGCSFLQSKDPIADVLDFSVPDAEQALALAKKAPVPDPAAVQCWPAMRKWLASLGAYHEIAREVKGPLAAYQRTRNVRRLAEQREPDYVRIACAAMVNESVDVFRKLMSLIKSP